MALDQSCLFLVLFSRGGLFRPTLIAPVSCCPPGRSPLGVEKSFSAGKKSGARGKSLSVPGKSLGAQTLCLKVQMHRNLGLNGQNKKNRHGKFRALNGGDSNDGDDMTRKLTGEMPNKEAFAIALSQTEHLIKQKSQNSLTSNMYKP